MGSLFKSPEKPAAMNVGAVQGQANQQNTANAYQNAAFNRVNQRDAFGNALSYTQTGTDAQGNPQFTANQELGQTGQMYAGGLAGLGQKYFETAGQGIPDSKAAFDRAYGYASANMEPRFQRSADAMENKLRNQGLDPTSEAYKSASNDLALQQNEARNNLVSSLQGQMFNQGLQSRQQQLSELMPGLQFGQTAMSPHYANTPGVNVGNVDVAGLNNAAFGQQWQGYQSDVAQRNAMLGGLASIGGSLMMAPMKGGTSLGGIMGSKLLGGLGALPGYGYGGGASP